ncbi:hypothetical protein [Propionivibrio sp.]|uniref:hypothetical protein n=1 Tax=Propionivibrio sp. TaxID=2212460 RepID=UPI003BF28907
MASKNSSGTTAESNTLNTVVCTYTDFSCRLIEDLCAAKALVEGTVSLIENNEDGTFCDECALLYMLREKLSGIISALDRSFKDYTVKIAA